jgi:hypothetical protein
MDNNFLHLLASVAENNPEKASPARRTLPPTAHTSSFSINAPPPPSNQELDLHSLFALDPITGPALPTQSSFQPQKQQQQQQPTLPQNTTLLQTPVQQRPSLQQRLTTSSSSPLMTLLNSLPIEKHPELKALYKQLHVSQSILFFM